MSKAGDRRAKASSRRAKAGDRPAKAGEGRLVPFDSSKTLHHHSLKPRISQAASQGNQAKQQACQAIIKWPMGSKMKPARLGGQVGGSNRNEWDPPSVAPKVHHHPPSVAPKVHVHRQSVGPKCPTTRRLLATSAPPKCTTTRRLLPQRCTTTRRLLPLCIHCLTP